MLAFYVYFNSFFVNFVVCISSCNFLWLQYIINGCIKLYWRRQESKSWRICKFEAKRDLWQSGPPTTSNFQCQICHMMCRSNIGLTTHVKSHVRWWDPSHRRLSPYTSAACCGHSDGQVSSVGSDDVITLKTQLNSTKTREVLNVTENCWFVCPAKLSFIARRNSTKLNWPLQWPPHIGRCGHSTDQLSWAESKWVMWWQP